MARWLPVLFGALSVPAWAGCGLSTMEIPVRIVNSRPIATLTLNGTEVPMLVDSGAFFSMLPESTAAQLKLPLRNLPFGFRLEGYTGAIEAQLTRVDRVGLRDAEMKRVEFIVGGNELGAGIMGILGRNILSVVDTEYDLAHGVIRLVSPGNDCEKSNMAYWAGDAPVVVVPLERSRGSRDTAIRVEVAINGRKTIALLDTGAPETDLTWRTAKASGIDKASLKPIGRVGGAGDGLVPSYVGMVDSFELGGEKISNNRMRISDTDNFEDGMLVGLDYFLSHRIYVARSQKKLYVTWNGGVIFAQQRANASGNYDQRYAALPEDLSGDDADALARRGNAFAAKRDYKRAQEDLSRAIELTPGVASFFTDRARILVAQHQGKAALADIDEALRLDPKQAEARVMRVRLRLNAKDEAGALADLAELDANLAPSAQQRAAMANIYVRLKRLPDALRQWAQWMPTHESDMQYAEALNNRCWARTRFNMELPQAVEDCKAAVSKDKTEANYRDSLGWAYLRLGDAQRSLKAFDGALELKPGHPWALYGRGLAQLKLKDGAASQRDLQEARKAEARIDELIRDAGLDVAPDAPAVAAKPAAKSASTVTPGG
ncbi:Tetratricopeptide repeat-containing protein [Roseateles sp. YR242]|uniref:aspartyl protease family protein n=1 Tax=Roseateles sp. YR242 TaxID=1855305 RepID=UPI0008B355B5|nr:aspartyl protease family protein [Roseateles sp. YR242]SEL86104.1 Tetratricopeptide repeat-containing protein [Roseateles sp. YR242]